MIDPQAFPDVVWSVGEEGSDPIVMRGDSRFRMDQFAASGHYEALEDDIASIASLGVSVVRYGTPWRLAEPEPGRFDWSLWDRAFAAFEAAGVEPIVEFLHFGLPDHCGGFLDGRWVDDFCRYVDEFLHRYTEPRWFTPVNEPGITARMTARLGLWNDMAATPEAHGQALANIVLANLEAIARIRADRDGWWIGSEGFDIPVSVAGNDADEGARQAAAAQVDRVRASSSLVWDLHFGVEPLGRAAHRLRQVPDETMARLDALAVSDRLVAGLDIYPISVQAFGGERPAWTVSELIDLALAEVRVWHERYGHPFWIAETSNLTLPISDQVPWLNAFAAGLDGLRADGLPARGLCWYSRGDQFDWQTALTNPVGAVTEVGLFDADRRARPVAARFAELATS